jgi:hypothetical protein
VSQTAFEGVAAANGECEEGIVVDGLEHLFCTFNHLLSYVLAVVPPHTHLAHTRFSPIRFRMHQVGDAEAVRV